jgi:TPR repeat protein
MFAAGAWYAVGKGVEADEEQARAWLEKYAESGNSIWSEQAQAILEELEAE